MHNHYGNSENMDMQSIEIASSIQGKPEYEKTKELIEEFNELIQKNFTESEHEILFEALRTSLYVHFEQKNRPDGSPYINHPLKVTNALLINSKEIATDDVIASLLHDAIEDQPDLVLKATETIGTTTNSKQEQALEVISNSYGRNVGTILSLLTHSTEHTYEENILQLVQNPIALRIKLVDFSENALRLDEIPDTRRREKLFNKYLPVAKILYSELENSDCGLKEVFRQELMQKLHLTFQIE